MTEKNILTCLNKIEPAYGKFRAFVGKVAVENDINPFALMCAFLEASLMQEKQWFEEAKKKANKKPDEKGVAIKIAGALGIKVEDLKSAKIGPNEMKKIIGALDLDELKDIMNILEPDDDEDEELDF